MKKELTISERGQVSMDLKSPENFYADLKLYNRHFGGSKLSVQLVKVNEMNMDSLHGRMLYELLSKVDEEDIINNRLTPIQLAAKKKAENAAKKAQLKAEQEAEKAKAEQEAEKAKAEQEAAGSLSTDVVPPVEGVCASADVIPSTEAEKKNQD